MCVCARAHACMCVCVYPPAAFSLRYASQDSHSECNSRAAAQEALEMRPTICQKRPTYRPKLGYLLALKLLFHPEMGSCAQCRARAWWLQRHMQQARVLGQHRVLPKIYATCAKNVYVICMHAPEMYMQCVCMCRKCICNTLNEILESQCDRRFMYEVS
jgi:hypothetical protein